ncbi:class I SAM-dependent methyltransferase [Hyphomicrobium sp.]|uniref:class I SAM-dependent methyltransferase n=1 Tax=Hyphomicrobium sp. TaxID=82 RepID=UPI002E37EC98|nr:class I SAM-dependent methyltransferase [Hyphomicrobium sp.]HEX2843374.1 class I SAM-dependent methyltransferase [Hyphomicrobium sp.]
MTELALHEDTACMACGSEAAPSRIGSVFDHEYRSTEMNFPVVRCEACDLVYLKPRPAATELGKIYPPSYYSYHLSGNAPQTGGAVSRVQQMFHARNRAALDTKLRRSGFDASSYSRPIRVLDVGCGVGAQLDLFRDLLPNPELHGVEIGELAVQKTRERGHKAYLGRFEDVTLPSDYFDILYSSHVIEHVENPYGFLEKCREVCAPNATIIIETPNTDCVEFGMLKERHWGGYHAPRHFYLFDPKNMSTMASRMGLKTIVAQPYPSPVFWNWTFHSLLMSVAGTRVADAIFPPVKIFYGGLRSFFLLGTFSVIESAILKLGGRASAFWIAFSKT